MIKLIRYSLEYAHIQRALEHANGCEQKKSSE